MKEILKKIPSVIRIARALHKALVFLSRLLVVPFVKEHPHCYLFDHRYWCCVFYWSEPPYGPFSCKYCEKPMPDDLSDKLGYKRTRGPS